MTLNSPTLHRRLNEIAFPRSPVTFLAVEDCLNEPNSVLIWDREQRLVLTVVLSSELQEQFSSFVEAHNEH